MPHLPPLIIDLALILGSAAVISFVFKFLKQPVVLGYILAGLFVGPNFQFFPTVVEIEGIKVWAEIGVIFLLFGLGLEFSFKKLLSVGGVAGLTAIIEVTLTLLCGYLLGWSLGWNQIDSLFFGGILAIASTTIIIRSFDELGVKSQKFAGIVTGILIIEDLVAVILMVLLSTVAVSRSFEGTEMLVSVLKLAFFLVLWFVSGIYFLPSLLKSISKYISDETLLILSVSLCLLMVLLAYKAGFSPALGAFIMGSILAETHKAEKIEHIVKPLKNLFGAVFFVSVGMLISLDAIIEYKLTIFLSVLILLFAKPFFVIVGTFLSGQPLKTSVQSGMSLSQIGEFSFIIASLGLTLKVTGEHLYPIAVAVSVVTTFTTPYMIRFSEPVYLLLEKRIPARWKKSLLSYSAGAQRISEKSEWKKYLRESTVNVIIHSVIIISIIVFGTQLIEGRLPQNEWNRLFTSIVCFLMISPFLWALSLRKNEWEKSKDTWIKSNQRGPFLAIRFGRIALAMFFIIFLFGKVYSPGIAFISFIVSATTILIFRRQIRIYYFKIESRFMSNLNARDSKNPEENILTPWDSHMATFELHSSLPFIGTPLIEARLRERFGINIAQIKRGEKIINVPGRYEKLYPNDIVSLIGTDIQLKEFKEYIETEQVKNQNSIEGHLVSLQHFSIPEDSPFSGKSIRESGIRELSKGLVVGIEREGQRYLNPESDFIFNEGDTVWLVGDDKRIQVLLREK
jgi:monovalent cation:H+ antiporter-2, CPA2 family